MAWLLNTYKHALSLIGIMFCAVCDFESFVKIRRSKSEPVYKCTRPRLFVLVKLLPWHICED